MGILALTDLDKSTTLIGPRDRQRLKGVRETVERCRPQAGTAEEPLIRVIAFVAAEFASVSQDGRVTIGGIMEGVNATPLPNARPNALESIILPPFYIVAMVEGSIADGLDHTYRIRIVAGNGETVVDDQTMSLPFILNAAGRPLRANLLARLVVQLPGPDDYIIQLRVDDAQGPAAEYSLFIDAAL